MIIRTNDRKNRIWERPKDEDILIESKKVLQDLDVREVTLEIPLSRLVEPK